MKKRNSTLNVLIWILWYLPSMLLAILLLFLLPLVYAVGFFSPATAVVIADAVLAWADCKYAQMEASAIRLNLDIPKDES